MEVIRCNLVKGNEKTIAMQQMVETFGGEENMKKKYPGAYSAYRNTINCRNKTLGATNTQNEESEFHDIDVLHVSYVDEKKDKICLVINSEFNNEAYCNIQSVKAFSKERDKEIAFNENMDFQGNGIYNELIINLKDISGLDDIVLKTNVVAIRDNVNFYAAKTLLEDFNLNYTAQFHVEHPVISTTNKDIRVSFYSSKLGYIWDYFYPKSWIDKHFRLPSKGEIKVGSVILSGIERCSLRVVQTGSLNKVRHYPNSMPYIHLKDTHTISWDFPEDWKFNFDGFLDKNYNDVTYDLTIHAVCEEGNVLTFNITNKIDAHAAINRHILPKLVVYTDCFAEGTLITRSDGSQGKIEQLKAGDVVLCGNNRTAKVQAVDASSRKVILTHLTLEDGTELCTTQGHMIDTPEGLRSISFLNPGELVKTQNGNVTVRKIEVVPEGEHNIVVVVLESEHRIYANKILVGDSVACLTESEKNNNIRYQLPEEWQQDYISWVDRK